MSDPDVPPLPDEVPPMPGEVMSAPDSGRDPVPPDSPWGFWATTGLSIVIFLGYVSVQFILGVVYGIAAAATGRMEMLENLETNGFFLGLVTCLGAPVAVGMAVLFAWLRRGVAVKDYLALRPVSATTLWRWGIVLLALVLASDGLTSLLDRTIVPDFMVSAYETAVFLPLLWLGVMIAAPVMEEILFRGFMFKGIEHSRLGGRGAIVLTALIWAVIHLQYDVYGMATIFVVGLLLGYVRLRTQSIVPTIVMHALMNLIATVQVHLYLNFVGDAG